MEPKQLNVANDIEPDIGCLACSVSTAKFEPFSDWLVFIVMLHDWLVEIIQSESEMKTTTPSLFRTI